jgi:bifunctional ADP-heptose synthase (sugar kinase/adenylyltransferase)
VDTRTKIVSNAEAREFASRSMIVSGYFDPMTKEHAERLQALKKPGMELMVLIATPANPILPPAARAALIAGLACVDHVTEIGAVYPDGLTPHLQLETEDAERLAQLIEHVRMRQQAGN